MKRGDHEPIEYSGFINDEGGDTIIGDMGQTSGRSEGYPSWCSYEITMFHCRKFD